MRSTRVMTFIGGLFCWISLGYSFVVVLGGANSDPEPPIIAHTDQDTRPEVSAEALVVFESYVIQLLLETDVDILEWMWDASYLGVPFTWRTERDLQEISPADRQMQRQFYTDCWVFCRDYCPEDELCLAWIENGACVCCCIYDNCNPGCEI